MKFEVEGQEQREPVVKASLYVDNNGELCLKLDGAHVCWLTREGGRRAAGGIMEALDGVLDEKAKKESSR